MSTAFDAPNTGFRLTAKPESTRRLLRDLWRSRDLLRMLGRQDFFVKYRRESFGFLWAVGLPLMQAVVLAVVFTRIVRIHTGTSYPVFVFSGILPWSFFAAVISSGSTSIVDGQGLATKIYFPRAILPLVGVYSTFYGFVPSVVVLVAMALVLGVHITAAILLLIPGTILVVVLSASFALVLSSLHVYFRDVRYIVTAAIFAWFYATPVLYPLSFAPPALRAVIMANPVTGCVELFRTSVGAGDPAWVTAVLVTCAWVVVLATVALAIHRRFDRLFIDPL